MRRVYALQFDLVTRPPRFTSIIVWPEQPVGRVHPANDQNVLHVRAGDVLLIAGHRRTVEAVRIYRGDGAANTTPVVECGRAWRLETDSF